MPVCLDQLVHQPAECQQWLAEIGLTNVDRGYANLLSVAKHDPGLAQTAPGSSDRLTLLPSIGQHLPDVSDPDRALNNLERFVAALHQRNINSPSRNLPLTDLLAPRSKFGIGGLMILFSDSQFISDWVISDRIDFELLKSEFNRLFTRSILVERLLSRLKRADTSADAMRVIRDFGLQQNARIACGDLINGNRFQHSAEQISFLAESICEGACAWAKQRLIDHWGVPTSADGQPARYVILAMGKLGGSELNYSSDIDLVMTYDRDGETNSGIPKTNRKFFEQLTRDIVRLLSEPTADGPAYRVDLRLRPEGSRGKICPSAKSMLHYYDFQGRTWERQALIKAKPIAGDLEFGNELLEELRPWIYRQNLNRNDIAGIKALKRRIERRTISAGEATTNIKTGHGGIRDIEFVIQFLQLLNGGVIPELNTPNTLTAIERLHQTGCLTSAESTLLTENYCWLRTLEHRLQLLFNLQTHTIPASQDALKATARRMGFRGNAEVADFQADLLQRTQANRSILNHLLHDAFGMNFGSLRDSGGQLAFAGDPEVPAEVDLVLEPEPDSEMITQVLQPYGFKNCQRAFENLMDLAQERTPFLSTRRCHHFLAATAPALLREIGETPDPDAALVALSTVSDSLGAKGVLWELFSYNPATLELYVRLCATSDYLSGILKRNPGMIDELLDALQVEQLPTAQFLDESLADLMRGAIDIEPIVYSFKHAQHLRVGTRDILGRDKIHDTHQTLSDIAEVSLQAITRHEYVNLLNRYQASQTDVKEIVDWDELESRCPFVILALGKLGGREPNYHSDLDLVFLYSKSDAFESKLPEGITSQYFFGQLAANITQFVTHSQQFGRLYELDSRLRPTGKSGPLAVSLNEFRRYFESGRGRLWERQTLCKARAVFGSNEMKSKIESLTREMVALTEWNCETVNEIRAMRIAMQRDCNESNLKRGIGGTVDVEFAVQAIQLRTAAENSQGGGSPIIATGTLAALEEMMDREIISADVCQSLADSYRLLRGVESRLRLMNTAARHDLPTDPMQLNKLAFLMGLGGGDELVASVAEVRKQTRSDFEQVFDLLAEIS